MIEILFHFMHQMRFVNAMAPYCMLFICVKDFITASLWLAEGDTLLLQLSLPKKAHFKNVFIGNIAIFATLTQSNIRSISFGILVMCFAFITSKFYGQPH